MSLDPKRLRCEYQVDPLGIDTAHPRLSWEFASGPRGARQTAYQILVASSADILAERVGDLWDTGRRESSETCEIVYEGSPLSSRSRSYWTVRVWDETDDSSDWSTTAEWETAFLDEAEWQAEWINDGRQNPDRDREFYEDDPAPLFRKPFGVPGDVAQARLYITGLGYYRASINGTGVGDRLFDPGWTDYRSRVLYSTYDVTGQVHRGENVVGVTLGNGWYNPTPLRMWGRLNLRERLATGRPRFLAELHVALKNGERVVVASDRSWRVAPGPVRFNSIYLGERYDARLELSGWDEPGFDDSGWRSPSTATEPIGKLCAQAQPPVRAARDFAPASIAQSSAGRYVVDMGVNFTGLVSVEIDEAPGTAITLRYAELLNEAGSINPMTSVAGQIKPPPGNQRGDGSSVGDESSGTGGGADIGADGAPAIALQSDTYIARGGGREIYLPTFTWHGFRFVEVSGVTGELTKDNVRGYELHADVESTGEFACSDERINRVQEMCRQTFLSNLMSVQSDCPHRERFAYGGDIAATAAAFAFNFDMAAFYEKGVRDFEDSADPSGSIPDTAPSVGLTYCGVAWSMAHPELLDLLYRSYGDRRIVEEQYRVARAWMESVRATHPDGIVDAGLCDHESLEEEEPAATVTQMYCRSARLFARLAAILGKADDARGYGQLADDIRAAYADRFVDPGTREFLPKSQTARVLALSLEMLPDDVAESVLRDLIAELEAGGHMKTGIFATPLLFELLADHARTDLALEQILRTDPPGYQYMLDNGATTLWEHWMPDTYTYSHNHPMFGSVSEWFFTRLAGIRPHPEASGWDRVVIHPQIPEGMTWVRGTLRTIRGMVTSQWNLTAESLAVEVSLPPSTQGTVRIPAASLERVSEGTPGTAASSADGVLEARYSDGEAVFEIASGSYRFSTGPV